MASRGLEKVAGPQGFEPRQTVPKTVVLPLHHGPTQYSMLDYEDLAPRQAIDPRKL